jgi:nucleotide-binding universal stress UspA family protein
MKILVAVDGSEFSDAIIQAVIAQYPTQGSEIRVLHVLEPTESCGYPVLTPESQTKQGQELVDQIAKKLRAAGFRVNAEVLIGEARAAIIDSAEEWRADVIVLGSHGRTAIGRFLLGSVSSAVMHHAPCSVQVVRLTESKGSED